MISHYRLLVMSELKLINDLKISFKNLPLPETIQGQRSETEWFQNMKRLKELVLTGDPREFLRWDVIKKTMFVVESAVSLCGVKLPETKRQLGYSMETCNK